MQINAKTVKNILVLRNDRFGEFLLNIPALRALKQTFVNAKIIAVIDPYVEEIARNVTFIDELITWPRVSHSIGEKLAFIRLLKTKKIDMAIMMNPSKEFNYFSFFSGIPIRAGYNRKCGFFLNYKLEDKKYLGDRHEVEYNLELVRLVGAQTYDKSLNLETSDSLFKELNDKYSFSNFAVVHPFTSDPIKQWPLKNFKELAGRLINELKLKVVIVGAKNDGKVAEDLFLGSGIGLINLTGKTTLNQLASILKKARFLVSGDSGPVHLACCVGTSVFAIFRNDIPEKRPIRWGPWGEGNVVIQANALSEITVNEVFNKITERFR